jgi:dipeptidyl aminopeptidase/acylaminoacyl peptidase
MRGRHTPDRPSKESLAGPGESRSAKPAPMHATPGSAARPAPCGAWKSPITSELIVRGLVGLGQIALDQDDLYFTETRPAEKGRGVIVVRRRGASVNVDITPRDGHVRTRVHEYGGGDYVVHEGTAYFSSFADQRVYRQAPGQAPVAISPEENLRFADYRYDARRSRLLCVREDKRVIASSEDVNTIVLLDPSGDLAGGRVIAEGRDFYASPRISRDGSRLAWLAWDHPNMPWDAAELWVASMRDDGALENAERVAGGPNESIFQPEWSEDGSLYFVSDRTDFWNLYRWDGAEVRPIAPKNAEFGVPQWAFGLSTYAIVDNDRLLCTFAERGTSRMGVLDVRSGALDVLDAPYTWFANVRASGGVAACVAGSPTEPPAVVTLDLATRRFEVIRRSTDLRFETGYISVPEAIEFPTTGGRTAHAFYYPPQNRDFSATPGEKPPLIVKVHGGPTAAASNVFAMGIQFWTSRGFAVVDVNYGGSTGYGRQYRERLRGQWGIVDVDDSVNAARYLAERGNVDPERLAITGGSAGGYTTLAALTFRDVFKAGASHYGISDLERLSHDARTGNHHKFESRYEDGLVAPYPDQVDVYRARSPIHHTDRLSCPIIFFQGMNDKVVLPNQAERMVEALRKKGLPVAYVPFEGEGHGFRQAANMKRALDAELYFYSRVFRFTPADPIEPVLIENL